jgi:hypothetical protein
MPGLPAVVSVLWCIRPSPPCPDRPRSVVPGVTPREIPSVRAREISRLPTRSTLVKADPLMALFRRIGRIINQGLEPRGRMAGGRQSHAGLPGFTRSRSPQLTDPP